MDSDAKFMKKKATIVKTHKAVVETLEGRRLLSAVNLTDGTLVLQGNSGSANKLVITIDSSRTMLTATANNVSKTFKFSEVQTARLLGGEHGDLVAVDPRFDKPVFVRTGAGSDTIYCGQGNDTVISGAGNDHVFGKGGDDLLVDGPGSDHLDTGSPSDAANTINFPTSSNKVSITSFSLIDADTNQIITGYENITSLATINLGTLPTRHLNIKANYSAGGENGSVLFSYDGGSILHVDNTSSFAMAGNNGSDYYAWTPSTGQHTIEAVPYAGKNASGIAGRGLVVTIKVIDDPGRATGGSPSSPPSGSQTGVTPASINNRVTGLVLYNADTNKPIQTLTDGATIDLAKVGTKNLSIVATIDKGTRSVIFGLDSNPRFRNEGWAPYAIAGDNNGDLNSWTPSLGQHTVTATPYTGSYGAGTAGAMVSLSFNVVNSASTSTTPTPAPTPTPTPQVGAPVPVISTMDSTLTAGNSVFVNALNSKLTSGDWIHAKIQWDFGDPGSKYNTLPGFNAAHAYDNPGTYTITMTLTNENGKTAVTTTKVTVSAAARHVIYVSNQGNDSNSGSTPGSAIRTVARANQLVSDNTEILFARGQTFDVIDAMRLEGTNITLARTGPETSRCCATPGR